MLTQHIIALLSEVQIDWRQTTEDDANPLDIALPLLDNTSVGLAHRHGEFLELKDRISKGLKSVVNEHFEAFNESIGSYRSVVTNVSNSQSVVVDLKETVDEATRGLKENDETLDTLNENLKSYNDMIILLTAIDNLKNSPSELESAINEKNYSKAQFILSDVNQKAAQHGLWELSALSNLKDYYQTQQDQLFEILVEEFHNIAYSKKNFNFFNSASEFLKLNGDSTNYSSVERFLMNTIETDIAEGVQESHKRVEQFVANFNKLTSDQENVDEEDDNINVNILNNLDEANPFNQILQLLTIIQKQGKLQTAIRIVIQRIPGELNQLINRVVEDTKLRHSKSIKALNSIQYSNNLLRVLSEDTYSSQVLLDLFWNFFKKLLFFLQVIHILVFINRKLEANNPDRFKIKLRDDAPDPHNILDASKLWELVTKETKSLVLAYISNEEISSLTSKLSNSYSYKESKNSNNSLFQFYKVDYNQEHTNQLRVVLQDLFPGFINSYDLSKIDSPYIEDNKFLRQTKIIPANILNMRYILEPFLLFVQGTSLISQDRKEEPLAFFNDFMNGEFLPLLEESFIVFYVEEVEELNSLETFEPYNDLTNISNTHDLSSKKLPIFRFFLEFKKFFNNVCFILNTSLQFRNEFSSILFKLLEKFLDKVQELYDDLSNEITSYLEPNREIIKLIETPSLKKISVFPTNQINKTELKNSKIYHNFQTLQNSLDYLLSILDAKLIKKVDLNKTDLNLTTIEKLRKNWSFFEGINLKSDLFQEIDTLDTDNINQVILNDELQLQYNEILGEYKRLDTRVKHVMAVLSGILQIV